MLTEFAPTYLMIKRHKVTGLRYFCKTIRKYPYKYNGSGKFWLRHIKKHGVTHIETTWCQLFYDKEDLIEFATFFSEYFDIVKSDEWANLIDEDGLTGFLSENSKKIQRERLSNKSHHLLSGDIQRATQNKLVKEGTHRWLSGEEQRETQNRLIKDGTHHFHNNEFKKSMALRTSAKNKEKIDDGSHSMVKHYTCPHCNKTGKGIAMFRHHFDGCKFKSC